MYPWLSGYIPVLIFFIILRQSKKHTAEYIGAKAVRKNGDKEMQKLAERLIGKDVLANTVASGTADGILKEVTDNAMVLEKNGREVYVNLDYVIRLREYPKNKKGNRKQIVTD